MKESGSSARTFVKVKENRSGQMDPCMKDGGKITKLTAKEDSFTLMEMSMMVNGSTTKPMDLEYTAILTVPSMKDIGRKISSMEMVSRPGQMVPSMRVNTSKARRMVREDLHGLTDQLTTECFTRTIFKVLANITGLMEENITDSG